MRQFNHEDDDVDYDELKRSRSEDRESIRDIRESLKIDEDDLMAKLARAASHASPDQRRAAAQKAALVNRGGGVSRQSGSFDPSKYLQLPEDIAAGDAPREAYASESHTPRMPSKYAEVVDVLNRFKFAEDEDRRAHQMKIVCAALRTAVQDLTLEDVAVNTKTAFKGYAEKVVKAPGGLKVYFNFGDNNKFTVTAKGGFFGDETICIHQDGGKIKAAVMRLEDKTDISESFEIIIQRIQ